MTSCIRLVWQRSKPDRAIRMMSQATHLYISGSCVASLVLVSTILVNSNVCRVWFLADAIVHASFDEFRRTRGGAHIGRGRRTTISTRAITQWCFVKYILFFYPALQWPVACPITLPRMLDVVVTFILVLVAVALADISSRVKFLLAVDVLKVLGIVNVAEKSLGAWLQIDRGLGGFCGQWFG